MHNWISTREGNQEPVPYCPIHWNRTPLRLSIPSINAATFFWQLCVAKTLSHNIKLSIYADGNLQQEGVMTERKTRSKAWLHFTSKDDNSATLNICKNKGWKHKAICWNIFRCNMGWNSRNAKYLTLYARGPIHHRGQISYVIITLAPRRQASQIYSLTKKIVYFSSVSFIFVFQVIYFVEKEHCNLF